MNGPLTRQLLRRLQPLRIRRARRSLRSPAGRPPDPRASSPLIVVGMHRSGTSITARVLDALGVDMGDDLTPNHESLAFALRNDTLLASTGAAWYAPQPLLDALSDPSMRRDIAVVAAEMLDASRTWLLRPCRHQHDLDPSRPWGWKDPRNSITWPVWLEIFPSARFVRVRRNTEDVVASLVTRTRQMRETNRGYPTRTVASDGARELADEYHESLDRLQEAVDPGRIVDVRYEDLVDDPASVVASLASWVGADVSLVAAAAGLVRPRPG